MIRALVAVQGAGQTVDANQERNSDGEGGDKERHKDPHNPPIDDRSDCGCCARYDASFGHDQ